MGESALLVTLGNRISRELNDRVHALASRLAESGSRGLIDLVPAYASLLVRFDWRVLPEAELRALLADHLMSSLSTAGPPGRTHVVPVRYGGDAGPDLDSVAAMRDLSPAEVISLHTRRAYHVYFLGFMPGFAYMGPVEAKIAVPRLSTPRVRVPAGSVALAGRQTAVYPFASPGGWRLIGQTGEAIWDAERPQPSLFAPGDTVSFVESNDEPTGPPAGAKRSILSFRPALEVVQPGALTTIQDLGRPGHARLGLGEGGACDGQAVARANALAGNSPDAAVLEITLTGPELQALHPVTVALEGADLGCRIDGALVTPGLSWLMRAGSSMRFTQSGRAGRGLRAYLAVNGGIEVPRVLGSRSTYLPASLGGMDGRPLRAGDRLDTTGAERAPATYAGRFWLGGSSPGTQDGVSLRFVRFHGPAALSSRALSAFCSGAWEVTPMSDRVGVRLRRLDGPNVQSASKEVTSFGVVRGAIQVPPDGNPVLLNADHQTTGGYPLAGVIIEADWPLLAQLTAGDAIRFVEVSCEEARTARNRARLEFERGLSSLNFPA